MTDACGEHKIINFKGSLSSAVQRELYLFFGDQKWGLKFNKSKPNKRKQVQAITSLN